MERTRQAREALARQCNYDPSTMLELLKSMQAGHPERVRQPPAAPTAIAKQPPVQAG